MCKDGTGREGNQKLPDSETQGGGRGRGGADAGGGASVERGEGEEGRAMGLTIWGLKV